MHGGFNPSLNVREHRMELNNYFSPIGRAMVVENSVEFVQPERIWRLARMFR
jgi:hypothetical protein